jgi:hypothetical protein
VCVQCEAAHQSLEKAVDDIHTKHRDICHMVDERQNARVEIKHYKDKLAGYHAKGAQDPKSVQKQEENERKLADVQKKFEELDAQVLPALDDLDRSVAASLDAAIGEYVSFNTTWTTTLKEAFDTVKATTPGPVSDEAMNAVIQASGAQAIIQSRSSLLNAVNSVGQMVHVKSPAGASRSAVPSTGGATPSRSARGSMRPGSNVTDDSIPNKLQEYEPREASGSDYHDAPMHGRTASNASATAGAATGAGGSSSFDHQPQHHDAVASTTSNQGGPFGMNPDAHQLPVSDSSAPASRPPVSVSSMFDEPTSTSEVPPPAPNNIAHDTNPF